MKGKIKKLILGSGLSPKNQCFANVQVTNIGEWISFADQLSKSGWIFRGQADSSWFVRSTLDRILPYRYPIAAYDDKMKVLDNEQRLRKFEHEIIDSFLGDKKVKEVNFHVLTEMQHYGAPTRLIDFTHSPFIACFFAFNTSYSCKCSVWAVNMSFLNRNWSEKFNEVERVVNKILGDNEAFKCFEQWDMIAVEPEKHINCVRVKAQQSIFLLPLWLSNSVSDVFNYALANLNQMDVLKSSTYDEVPRLKYEWKQICESKIDRFKVIKFTFENNFRSEVLNVLKEKGIVPSFVFPDMSLKEKKAQDIAFKLKCAPMLELSTPFNF